MYVGEVLMCSLLWPHSEVPVHNCCTCETSAEVAHSKSDYGFWFRRFMNNIIPTQTVIHNQNYEYVK